MAAGRLNRDEFYQRLSALDEAGLMKERTRWRFTYQRLAKATTQALAGPDVEPAASAMATLIDLACELRSVDYFRSEDPVEASRFVVSDAAAVMWSAIRWHAVLRERLAHGEYEDRLDVLAGHPALVRST